MLPAPALSAGADGHSQWPAALCPERVILDSQVRAHHLTSNRMDEKCSKASSNSSEKTRATASLSAIRAGTYSFISVRSTKTLTFWQKGSGCRLKREQAGGPAGSRQKTSL